MEPDHDWELFSLACTARTNDVQCQAVFRDVVALAPRIHAIPDALRRVLSRIASAGPGFVKRPRGSEAKVTDGRLGVGNSEEVIRVVGGFISTDEGTVACDCGGGGGVGGIPDGQGKAARDCDQRRKDLGDCHLGEGDEWSWASSRKCEPASCLYREILRSAHDCAFGWRPARRREVPRPGIILPLFSHRIAEVKLSKACFPSL